MFRKVSEEAGGRDGFGYRMCTVEARKCDTGGNANGCRSSPERYTRVTGQNEGRRGYVRGCRGHVTRLRWKNEGYQPKEH